MMWTNSYQIKLSLIYYCGDSNWGPKHWLVDTHTIELPKNDWFFSFKWEKIVKKFKKCKKFLERFLMKCKQSSPKNLASLMSKMVKEMGYLPSVLMANACMKF